MKNQADGILRNFEKELQAKHGRYVCGEELSGSHTVRFDDFLETLRKGADWLYG